MSVSVHAQGEGGRGRVTPAGAFDLAHAPAVARALNEAEPRLEGCRTVDVDLGQIGRLDGTGAALIARFLDQLAASGRAPRLAEDNNPEAARRLRCIARLERASRRPTPGRQVCSRASGRLARRSPAP